MTYDEHRIHESELGGARGARRRSELRRARRLTQSGRLADDRPLRVVLDDGQELVEQWTEWYHRRVQRARRARARAAGPHLATVAFAARPTGGDHRRAPKSGRRRTARRGAARSSSDDPANPAYIPRGGGHREPAQPHH